MAFSKTYEFCIDIGEGLSLGVDKKKILMGLRDWGSGWPNC